MPKVAIILISMGLLGLSWWIWVKSGWPRWSTAIILVVVVAIAIYATR